MFWYPILVLNGSIKPMIIYNVTSQIDPEIEKEWLKWMQESHLPSVFECGAFEAINILRIQTDAIESLNYAIQFVTSSKAELKAFLYKYGDAFQAAEKKRFGGKVLRFETQLEIIHSIS